MTKTLPEILFLVEQQQHIKQKVRQIQMVKVVLHGIRIWKKTIGTLQNQLSDFL